MKYAAGFGLAMILLSRTSMAAEGTPTWTPPKEEKLRLGPVFGLGAPSGGGAGLSTTIHRLIGIDARAQYVPWLTLTGDTKISRVSYESDIRLYPTRGSFFVGVAGGYAQLHGAAVETAGTGTQYAQKVSARAGMDYGYVRPELGFQWVFENGMMVGLRGGAEIPVWHSQPSATVTTQEGPVSLAGKQGATTALSFLGTHPLPAVTLFEVGYML